MSSLDGILDCWRRLDWQRILDWWCQVASNMSNRSRCLYQTVTALFSIGPFHLLFSMPFFGWNILPQILSNSVDRTLYLFWTYRTISGRNPKYSTALLIFSCNWCITFLLQSQYAPCKHLIPALSKFFVSVFTHLLLLSYTLSKYLSSACLCQASVIISFSGIVLFLNQALFHTITISLKSFANAWYVSSSRGLLQYCITIPLCWLNVDIVGHNILGSYLPSTSVN